MNCLAYQRLTNGIFHKLEFIFGYLEDISIAKSSDTEHFEQLRQGLDLLSTNTVESVDYPNQLGPGVVWISDFFRIIDQMRSYNKTTYTHTVIYCTL